MSQFWPRLLNLLEIANTKVFFYLLVCYEMFLKKFFKRTSEVLFCYAKYSSWSGLVKVLTLIQLRCFGMILKHTLLQSAEEDS